MIKQIRNCKIEELFYYFLIFGVNFTKNALILQNSSLGGKCDIMV